MLFLLRQVTEHFTSHGSDVFVASLHASKAFDRINHYRLYSTLNRTNVPKMFIRIVINWYGKLFAKVKWNDCLSNIFPIYSGVRQGGVLSPFLLNCYTNIIILDLKKSNLGCKLDNVYIGCIMYEDDILLISGSILNLKF